MHKGASPREFVVTEQLLSIHATAVGSAYRINPTSPRHTVVRV